MKTKILIFLAMIFMANGVYAEALTETELNKYKKEKCTEVTNIAEEAVQMSAFGIPMEDYLYRYFKAFSNMDDGERSFVRKIVLESYSGQKTGRGVLSKIYTSCYNGEKFAPLYVQGTIRGYKKMSQKTK